MLSFLLSLYSGILRPSRVIYVISAKKKMHTILFTLQGLYALFSSKIRCLAFTANSLIFVSSDQMICFDELVFDCSKDGYSSGRFSFLLQTQTDRLMVPQGKLAGRLQGRFWWFWTCSTYLLRRPGLVPRYDPVSKVDREFLWLCS